MFLPTNPLLNQLFYSEFHQLLIIYAISMSLDGKFGEAIYHCPEVSSVFIKINFKDGSSIGFRRDEGEDDFERLFVAEDDETI